YGRFARPILAGEQYVLGSLEPRTAAAFDQRDEDGVDLALNRLEARHVIGIFGQERIQHRLVLARRIKPPFDADSLDQVLKAETAADHADRAEDRGRIAKNLVAGAGDHVAAGGRDVLDKHQHRQFLFRGKLPDPQIDLP